MHDSLLRACWNAIGVSADHVRPNRGLLSQISFDHADEQTNQKFPLARGDRGENAFVRGEVCGAQSRVKLFAFGRQAQETRAPVSIIHLTLHQALFHELLNQQAGGVAIDVEPIGKAVLFDSRLAGQLAEVDQHSVLQRSKAGFADDFRGLGHTDLMKPPRDGGRHAMPWRSLTGISWRRVGSTSCIFFHKSPSADRMIL